MKPENKESIFSRDILHAMIPDSNKDGDLAPYAKEIDILNKIEILSLEADNRTHHALSSKNNFENKITPKNDIIDLVKSGCALPDVDSPEKMLLENNKKQEDNTPSNETEESAYKMVNLISKNYNLPDIDNNLW